MALANARTLDPFAKWNAPKPRICVCRDYKDRAREPSNYARTFQIIDGRPNPPHHHFATRRRADAHISGGFGFPDPGRLGGASRSTGHLEAVVSSEREQTGPLRDTTPAPTLEQTLCFRLNLSSRTKPHRSSCHRNHYRSSESSQSVGLSSQRDVDGGRGSLTLSGFTDVPGAARCRSYAIMPDLSFDTTVWTCC